MGIIRTIYDQDVPGLTQTLLALGRYDRAPDQQALTERIGIFLHKYEAMPMADMDMGVLVDEFVQILNEYGVSVPASLTMLGRSLLVIQGMLTSVSPDANVIEIVAEYVKNTALSREHIEKEGQNARAAARPFWRKAHGAADAAVGFSEQGQRRAADRQREKIVVGRGARRAVEAAEPAHLCVAGLLAAVLRSHHVSRPLPRVLGLPWPALVFFRRRRRCDDRAV